MVSTKKGHRNLGCMGVTYLRLSDDLLAENNFKIFKIFLKKLHADQDYCPDPTKYNHEIDPLERSQPKFSNEELMDLQQN